ncbi:hypothetical protein V1478_001153, partial [Vespula squamosa]
TTTLPDYRLSETQGCGTSSSGWTRDREEEKEEEEEKVEEEENEENEEEEEEEEECRLCRLHETRRAVSTLVVGGESRLYGTHRQPPERLAVCFGRGILEMFIEAPENSRDEIRAPTDRLLLDTPDKVSRFVTLTTNQRKNAGIV